MLALEPACEWPFVAAVALEEAELEVSVSASAMSRSISSGFLAGSAVAGAAADEAGALLAALLLVLLLLALVDFASARSAVKFELAHVRCCGCLVRYARTRSLMLASSSVVGRKS